MTYCPRWARGAESGPAVVGLRRRLGDHLAEKAPDQSKLEERINAWFEANEERKARLAEEVSGPLRRHCLAPPRRRRPRRR